MSSQILREQSREILERMQVLRNSEVCSPTTAKILDDAGTLIASAFSTIEMLEADVRWWRLRALSRETPPGER